MVDSTSGFLDNIIAFPSSMSEPLPRAAASPEVDISLEGSADLSREGVFPAVDFSLPSFDGENRTTALIIGFSLILTVTLTGIAFALVSLGFKLLSIFS